MAKKQLTPGELAYKYSCGDTKKFMQSLEKDMKAYGSQCAISVLESAVEDVLKLPATDSRSLVLVMLRRVIGALEREAKGESNG